MCCICSVDAKPAGKEGSEIKAAPAPNDGEIRSISGTHGKQERDGSAHAADNAPTQLIARKKNPAAGAGPVAAQRSVPSRGAQQLENISQAGLNARMPGAHLVLLDFHLAVVTMLAATGEEWP